MKSLNANKIVAVAIAIGFFVGLQSPPSSAAPRCTSSEKSQYKKAKSQFINDNSIIFLANKIKAIVEDARSQKSELYGSFVDYTAKDLYTLQKQDAEIVKAEEHRDSWEPTLRRLSQKCKLPMPSKSQLNPGTDSL
jgi:hypothetical protein